MTDLHERIAALREAVEKMTPGEWRTRGTETLDVVYTAEHHKMFVQCHSYNAGYGVQAEERRANAAGIVALRNNAIAIIDELLSEQRKLIADNANLYAIANAESNENERLRARVAELENRPNGFGEAVAQYIEVGPTPLRGRITARNRTDDEGRN